MLNKSIYSDAIPTILSCISRALIKCIEIGHNSKNLHEGNGQLIACFEDIKKKNFDEHISRGLFKSQQERKDNYPRLLRITINAFKEAGEINSTSSYIIPSPFHILYYALIVPEHPQTAAYSLAACRTTLFEIIRNQAISNSNKHRKGPATLLGQITEQDIMDSLDTFASHIKIQARWPKDISLYSTKSQTNLLVGHFLAMKGVAHLWFQSKVQAKSFLENKRKDILKHYSNKISACRFRISPRHNELLEAGEIINQLFGIPVPLKGAETVLHGGLKPASAGGIVMSASGQPGIGKTSFAIALANAFSPLGIKTLYISLEEDEADIKKRLKTLQSPYQNKLSVFNINEEFLFVKKIKQTLTLDQFVNLIRDLKEKKINSKSAKENSLQFRDAHSLIVIDNLNEFAEESNYSLIEELIEELRSLKSIVLLISGDGVIEKLKMGYLIDVGIHLEHSGIEKSGEKPIRLFKLFKTRHQLSRPGTHIYHMSGDDGFRIAPQIPSQMDRKEKIRKNLHDETKVIDTLNYVNENTGSKITLLKWNEKAHERNHTDKSFKDAKKNKSLRFVSLFPRTHILVHGYGSSGKAGLAIKLLLTPPVDSSTNINLKETKSSVIIERRKVLILSFLYPQKYYDDLIYGKNTKSKRKVGLQERIKTEYKNAKEPVVEYIIFYPGYLTPEDFVDKITRKLDKAILEGQPFTGVLIDGLHNVFLQFIKLQENDMVWPLLYNILSRYDLTVVSTFTNFALNDRFTDDDPQYKNNLMNQALPDHMLLQKGMAPFLHALVKASDFYLFLEHHVVKGERKYFLSIKGAIGQDVPTELLEWDRQNNVFVDICSYKEIQKS